MDALDQTNSLYWVADRRLATDFPPTSHALDDPPGLLAAGGDLSPGRLQSAYRLGIFPWFSPDQPVLWWSPDPRVVITPGKMHISRSLARTIRRARFEIRWDYDFAGTVDACAAPRDGQSGTWITAQMRDAYVALHEIGIAHSMECWSNGELCGGVYGVAMGQVFFGESMFSKQRDASKVALAALSSHLYEWGYVLLDCQIENPHLMSLGARNISRFDFESILQRHVDQAPSSSAWTIVSE
jgi:leucyl/phenylalanyl-tRNA---protein transferase